MTDAETTTGTGAVAIRPLVASDHAAWAPLWAAYLDFYRQQLAEGVTETVFARISGDGAHGGLVAERAGQMIGFVHYIVHETTWSLEPTCYLEDLYVDGAVRGGGAGRALIEAVYEVARARGCRSVYWQTHDDNARARALYDKVAVLSPFVRYDRVLTQKS
ncbi:GNAT family N-acetyltransferase [Stappia sp. MMSF_3263]|uniref:GNAT family N-acetyltransferase n=1 Tax=Stappia sp. MMSF_3263 TaxID=3046693 RepID=UPI00273FCBD8|nr:GNAT family N-acetyltransferase [Stappia sp. MMSF_3263]